METKNKLEKAWNKEVKIHLGDYSGESNRMKDIQLTLEGQEVKNLCSCGKLMSLVLSTERGFYEQYYKCICGKTKPLRRE